MTAATNRRNRRANNRSRRRTGDVWTPRAARQRRADTATFTYSDPMFLTAVDGPSGRLATYVYDSESKRRRVYEGAAFTTIVWDGWDYLQWRRPSGTHVFHTMNGEVVGESVGGTVRDYLHDPLGSVVATLDSGGIVDQFAYWPYGEPVDDLPAGAPVFLWVGGLGYWFDADERRYVRHRMLRTDLGSWMQLDPLWPVASGTSYVGASPITAIDPSGLWQVQGQYDDRTYYGIDHFLDDLKTGLETGANAVLEVLTFGIYEPPTDIRDRPGYNESTVLAEVASYCHMGSGALKLLRARKGIEVVFWRYPRSGGGGMVLRGPRPGKDPGRIGSVDIHPWGDPPRPWWQWPHIDWPPVKHWPWSQRWPKWPPRS